MSTADLLKHAEYGQSKLGTGEHQILSNRLDIGVTQLTNLVLSYEEKPILDTVICILNECFLKHVACLSFSSEISDDVTLLSAFVTYPHRWQSRYFLRQYHLIDPIITVGVSALQPFDWNTVRSRSQETESFFADAAKHEVGKNGITIPIRRQRGGVTLVSLSSDIPEERWKILTRNYIQKLKLFAVLIAGISAINEKLPAGYRRLSRREQQTLLWAARGKTVNETADIMNIAYGSARTYLEAAKQKLRCVNVTQAVAVATSGIPSFT